MLRRWMSNKQDSLQWTASAIAQEWALQPTDTAQESDRQMANLQPPWWAFGTKHILSVPSERSLCRPQRAFGRQM